ncbi:Ulp1-like peptidase [Cucumis melo var. makuwa]|uniref:Ulp1-like peptidase n=1 Tax=Cucumis melo var. makuwa TaxID=1194695 RepID=A0A5D3BDB5_CUCMM|nr:Ulp1-like peptidase [Cucumis melo var. makuwa]
MFKKTIFGHFLDVKFIFNGLLCHYILLREVEDERDNVISFKLLHQNVSFGQEDFNTITRLRARPRRPVQFEEDLFSFSDTNDGSYLIKVEFVSKLLMHALAISLLLVLSGLGIRDSVVHKWSCTYSPGLKARIQAIQPTEEELAYLDQVFNIPSIEGYEDVPDAFLQDDALPSHPYGQHQLQFLAHHQPPPDAHPLEHKDNLKGFASDIGGPSSTHPEPAKAEASVGHSDSKLDDMELKLDRMDLRLDCMESSFTTKSQQGEDPRSRGGYVETLVECESQITQFRRKASSTPWLVRPRSGSQRDQKELSNEKEVLNPVCKIGRLGDQGEGRSDTYTPLGDETKLKSCFPLQGILKVFKAQGRNFAKISVKQLFRLLGIHASSRREIRDGCLGGTPSFGHMNVSYNPKSTSRDINGDEDHEKGGDEDRGTNKNPDVGVVDLVVVSDLDANKNDIEVSQEEESTNPTITRRRVMFQYTKPHLLYEERSIARQGQDKEAPQP